MGFETLVEQITTIGLALVIVVFVILYVRERAARRSVVTDRREDAQEKEGTRWGELGYQTVRNALHDNKVDQSLAQEEREKVTAKFDMTKRTIMLSALRKSFAKRVLYFAYHNGGDDYQNNPFKRMSCETEVMTEDVPPIMNKYKDLFRSYLYTVYEGLNLGQNISIPDIEAVKARDPSFYVTMAQDDIKAFYAAPIKNERGNTFAFVAFCYSDVQTNIDIPEHVDNTAHRLEGLYFGKHQEEGKTQ